MNTPAPARATYTIVEFCDAHRLSRSSFYEQVRAGTAPRLMRVNRRVLISTEAAADWRAAMEQATNQKCVEA